VRQVKSVSPFRCRMSDLHARLEGHVTEESCKAEIESFLRHGQLVPVLGRPLRGDPDCDVELIYGARRLFVARHLNMSLQVEIRALSDREAIIAMDIENRHRTDISAYERGLSYLRWLRTGHFDSQERLARGLRVSSSQVSRLLKLARLPAVIVQAFGNPLELCEGWGLDLSEALEDPERRAATLAKARAICAMTPRPPARDVYRSLLAAPARGRKLKARPHDDVVKGEDGVPLFRIKYLSSAIAMVIPANSVSSAALKLIERAIAARLNSTHAQHDNATS
jgi:ParB family transcriptional regulator, chromosome partitioning protein